MRQVTKNKMVIKDICTRLGVDLKVDSLALNTFSVMHWDVENEVHVLAFVSHLFLIDKFKLPIFYVCQYPESMIKAINTFNMPDNEEPLNVLLLREFLLMDNENKLAEILTNFAMLFIGLWKRNINKDIV